MTTPFSVLLDHPRFLRPALDNRNYRLVSLNNNLKALLIHDPDTDKSAAALDVNVGSFADPPQLPGLAHFCEHLLFLGTQKYPQENEYGAYLSQNSGHSNAFTAPMHTNYYFEVKNDALHGALDRFSQFFISPLFSPAGKDREINAVDSENKKNLQSDNWRFYQLARGTANKAHPYFGFSTGNKTTLGDKPLEMGLNVRDELIKFHSSNYSSNLMALCILSNEPLDTLTNWAVDMFSGIENKNLPAPYYQESPFDSPLYNGKIYKIKPIRESRNLELTFPIPATSQFWECLPARYFAHLIGHESKGSLLYNFKRKGWANGLSCGAGAISPGFSEFNVEIELTDNGLNHYKEIIQDVFKYFEMLKAATPQKWVQEELMATSANEFKFKQKSEAASTVSRLAGAVHGMKFHEIPLKNPLEANPDPAQITVGGIPYENLLSLSVVKQFDSDVLSKMMAYLTPQNFRVFLISKEIFSNIDEKDILTEKWYGTEYTVGDYPLETLEKIELDPAYSLPEHNLFIPTDFSLTEYESTEYPRLVEMDHFSKVWFKANPSVGGPRSAVTIKFNLPGSTSTPLNSLYLSLFVELLEDELNSLSYLANLAGLQYHFNIAREGMSLEVIGYSHKLEVLLKKLVETLNDFTTDDKVNEIWDSVRERRFEILKDKLSRNLKNFGYSTPYQQVGPIVSSLVNENSWLVDDEISCLPALDYKSLINYSQNLMKICFAEVMVLGNYSKEEAKHVHQVLKENLPNLSSSITLTQSQFTRGRSLSLPEGSKSHYIKPNDDPENINSCVEMFIQLGLITDSRSRVLNELCSQIIHEPCFTRLRTKEQLGYVVFSGTRETRTTFGLRVLIQSEYPSFYLVHRIHAFLEKMLTQLNEMEVEEFDKHVSSLINKKEQKFKNLKEERNKHWNRIASGYYDFDRLKTDVEILKEVSQLEASQFMCERIVKSFGHGELTVHLQSQKTPAVNKVKMVKNAISNFVYSKHEFDEVEYEQEKVDSKIEELISADDIDLNKLLADPLFAEFPYKSQLKKFIEEYLERDWSTITEDDGEHIGNIGEWKCQKPLTSAPTAIIPSHLIDL